MGGRGGARDPWGHRPGATAPAAVLSAALHAAIFAALGALPGRGHAPTIAHYQADSAAVEITPIELPAHAAQPAPTAGVTDEVVEHNDVRRRAAARPRGRARPKLLAQATPPGPPPPPTADDEDVPVPSPPPPADPVTSDAPADQTAAIEPRAGETSARRSPVRDAAAPEPPPDAAARGAPADDAAAADGGTGVVAAAPGPTSGVIGVGAPGGSPLAFFVNQLNNQVRGQWRPKEVYQRLDPRGRLAPSMFFTVLNVRIRADGTLEKATVQSSCGIPELDNEALEAFKRAPLLPRPPPEVLDASGGYALRFGFLLDVSTFHFRSQVQRTIMERWRGSPAFNRAGDRPRITLARMLLTREGVLVKALLLASAGIDFLDEGVLKVLSPGLQFPPPPPALVKHPGLIPVDLEFTHNVRGFDGIRMVGPHEGAETK
jgi:TonB family protein